MKQFKQKFIEADGTKLKPNKKNQRQNLDESSYLRWKCKYHAKFNKLDTELKIYVINKSIKILRKNYYNPRSKKVKNLIKNFETKKFTRSSLAGCIFHIENENLCLKVEKR